VEDPVEARLRGTRCFLNPVSSDQQLYRIVGEAEYLDAEAAKGYYLPFLRRYPERLAQAVLQGGIITYNPGSLAASLMGLDRNRGDDNPSTG